MAVEHSDAKADWKIEASRLASRIDALHEVLEAQVLEIDLLREEVGERQKLYDALSVNADAIAREVIEVMESRRPLADAVAVLHDAVSQHLMTRKPGTTKTATGLVYHGDPVDSKLYESLTLVNDLLKGVKGLTWRPRSES